MYLDCRDRHGFERIEDRHARMGVCCGIDDDTVDFSVCILDFVDQVALMIRLIAFNASKSEVAT